MLTPFNYNVKHFVNFQKLFPETWFKNNKKRNSCFCLTLKSPNLTSLYCMQLILRASKGMGNIRLWNAYSPPRFVKRKIWIIVWNLPIQFHLNPWVLISGQTYWSVMLSWFPWKYSLYLVAIHLQCGKTVQFPHSEPPPGLHSAAPRHCRTWLSIKQTVLQKCKIHHQWKLISSWYFDIPPMCWHSSTRPYIRQSALQECKTHL